jgi:hypothetical protein
MTRKSKKSPGILYLLLVELEGKSLVKIGVTHRTIEDRVVEILTSIFKKYREFPYCRPKRYRVTTDIYGKEKVLHKMFENNKYTTAKKFSGHTEFFDVPLEKVVAAYEKLLRAKATPVVKK